ncbi:hypothetical protein LXL04_027220 [Taraxacum kok-saghyz]
MGLSSKQASGDHIELNWNQNMLTTSETVSNVRPTTLKRPLPSQQSDPVNCPRCDSTNTKFCYYNNYNKTQPRHFCKACKRHWTKGGTLRNVPVGGGRKNKRIKRHITTTTAAAVTSVDHGLGLNGGKYMYPDDKGLFFKASDSEFEQVSWDFNGGFTSTMQPPAHQNLGFSMLSSLTSMDTNPIPMIPNSFSPLLTSFKDDSNSTLTATRMMVQNSATASHPWMQVPTTSNFLEPNNYWNWNDIDSIVQADLNKPFEDPQV